MLCGTTECKQRYARYVLEISHRLEIEPPHLTSRFYKDALDLNSFYNMISEFILTRLMGLLDHPLSGRYRTILNI